MKAAVVAEVLGAIYEEKGALEPEWVVEAARVKSHPLHECFDWDNRSAGEKYRVEQARSLIRSVKIRFVADEDAEEIRVRAWQAARNVGQTRGYLPESEIRADPVQRELLLRRMQADWTALRRRYQQLSEFWALVVSEVPTEMSRAS